MRHLLMFTFACTLYGCTSNNALVARTNFLAATRAECYAAGYREPEDLAGCIERARLQYDRQQFQRQQATAQAIASLGTVQPQQSTYQVIQPTRAPMPQPVNCISQMIGAQVYTNCN